MCSAWSGARLCEDIHRLATYQKIIAIEISPNLAGGYRSIKKHVKCGPESPLEVRGQALEGWISRMQCR